ncbi:hypothetical protein GCK72_009120 [Caenorhabditis remanei]|uniref:Uncharacterized protein n=1 Tax=Caenorhabditis remanei TaxID=31234 RepID=A0A6A5H1G9_CAERE|nr:hypothetical protein GCK72_009120 [Caenorhabditis remanei]KAF1760869.1 hypothetical protein GCK72_009120 [Caenorhabditis remanei]
MIKKSKPTFKLLAAAAAAAVDEAVDEADVPDEAGAVVPAPAQYESSPVHPGYMLIYGCSEWTLGGEGGGCWEKVRDGREIWNGKRRLKW